MSMLRGFGSVVVVGLVALGSCGVSCPCRGTACSEDAGPEPECVPDSDFSLETAQTAVPGTPVTGKICPVQDQDFWAFSTTTDSLAEITLTTQAAFSAVDYSISVIGPSGTSVGAARDTDGSDGPTSIRLAVALDPNTAYTIIVSDVGSEDVDERADYTLTITLHAQPDAHEPNDVGNPTAADVTATGNTGYLATSADVDAFQFDAPAGSIMRFGLSVAEDATIYPTAVVTNAAGVTLYSSPANVAAVNGVRAVRTNIALKGAGPFMVVVAEPQGGADIRIPQGQYTLLTEVIPDPDVDERAAPTRNDDLDKPIVVPQPMAAATLRPSLSTAGDTDHYMITQSAAEAATGRKVLEVAVQLPAGTPVSSFDPVVIIWDAVLSVSGQASANCQTPTTPGGNRGYVCLKPCSAGGSCGNAQEVCMAADPAVPNANRMCTEARIHRVLKVRPDGSVNHVIRYPLRSGRNPVVALSDQLSDGYDERVFTMTVQIVDDPDTHEPDDLPPPLLAVGGSSTDVRQNDLRRYPHAELNSGGGYPGLCPQTPDADGGIPDGGPNCWGRIPPDAGVTVGGDGGVSPLRLPIDCGNFAETTMEVTGYLAYEGDRDYYRFYAPPGFISADIEYSYVPPGGGTTPVELTMFLYTADSSGDLNEPFAIRGSFVRTQLVNSVNANRNCQFDSQCPDRQECAVRPGMGVCKLSNGDVTSTGCSRDSDCNPGACRPPDQVSGVCRGDCAANLECVNPDAGVTNAVCIERHCFQDEDNNQGTGGLVSFGPSSSECLFLSQCNPRPFYIEVVDNGLNDSDRATPYTLRVRMSCGCPAAHCDGNTCTYLWCDSGN